MPTKVAMKCKVCRQFGESVCGRPRCAVKRRQSPPGQHGPTKAARRRRQTDYGKQLMEKQKARAIYNILEKQFRKYVALSTAATGNTSVNLVRMLENRLDNAVYRLGLAPTRRAARQMVGHGLISVDGKAISIPSYQMKVGQVISVKDKIQKGRLGDSIKPRLENITAPSWLTLDAPAMSGKVVGSPAEDDFDKSFNAGQIIEFYSR